MRIVPFWIDRSPVVTRSLLLSCIEKPMGLLARVAFMALGSILPNLWSTRLGNLSSKSTKALNVLSVSLVPLNLRVHLGNEKLSFTGFVTKVVVVDATWLAEN